MNITQARYAHFDRRLPIKDGILADNIMNYIENKDNIAKHGFYPFIKYQKTVCKFSKNKYLEDKKLEDDTLKNKGIVSKTRNINYCTHLDRAIYRYYSDLLNEKYNIYANEHDLNDVSVAYRNNLSKNNIHFAKQAFDFIKQGECDILIGDFTSFFDNLDHQYLKQMLCKVLDTTSLPDDWYAVYKNITQYSTWDLVSILKINGLLNKEELKLINQPKYDIVYTKAKILNKQDCVLTKKQFKENSKTCIQANKSGTGIPQGSNIGAVLSNVYMIEFDELINNYIKDLNGLYLRYCDDFIVVVPKNDKTTFKSVIEFVNERIKDTKKLTIQHEKSKVYRYQNQVITISHKDYKNVKASIDYLGFVFDGEHVNIRPKTISKYYYRMYRKLNFIVKCKGVTKNGKNISYRNLYKTYTQKGRNGQRDVKNKNHRNGNFITYVYKADGIFNNSNSSNEPIKQHTNRHMLKIRRKIDSIKQN